MTSINSHRGALLAALAGVLAFSGCKKDPEVKDTADTGTPAETGETGDTAGTDTGEPPGPCETTIVETDPEAGASEWYIYDALTLTFSDPATDATIQVLDGDGAEVPLIITWESDDFRAKVMGDPSFEPSMAYTLHVEICEDTVDVAFSTSAYGETLELEPAELVDNTYVIDFADVDFTEPEGVGAYLRTLLTNPLLVGVVAADASSLTLQAVLGKQKNDGSYKQLSGAEVWSFDDADFTGQPFFSADIGAIEFAYGDMDIPVDDFHLEGTFAADGSSFGGGKVSGILDTRPISEGLGFDEDYLCVAVASFGVACEPCAGDGEPYCLGLLAEDVFAPLEEGLIIDPAGT